MVVMMVILCTIFHNKVNCVDTYSKELHDLV